MTDAPKRIWAWVDDLAGVVGTSQKPETPQNIPSGPNALTATGEYLRADLIDMDVLRRVEAALETGRLFIGGDVAEDGGLEMCDIGLRTDFEAASTALADLRAMMEKMR